MQNVAPFSGPHLKVRMEQIHLEQVLGTMNLPWTGRSCNFIKKQKINQTGISKYFQ